MSPEQQVFQEADLSIGQEVIDKTNNLLVGSEIAREKAARYIKSPLKRSLELVTFGFFGSIFSAPLAVGSMLGVYIADGVPITNSYTVGFLGIEDKIVNPTRLHKIRSLRREETPAESQDYRDTSFYKGGRRFLDDKTDPRVHSKLGALSRRTGVDEIPQFWLVFTGKFSGIGLRAYTLPEIEWQKNIFEALDNGLKCLPEGFPDDYREVVSFVEPQPGIISLYTATYRKALTPAERLWTDYQYLTRANLAGDLRITTATVKNLSKGVGAR